MIEDRRAINNHLDREMELKRKESQARKEDEKKVIRFTIITTAIVYFFFGVGVGLLIPIIFGG